MVLVLDMPKKRLQEGFNLHVDVGMYANYQTKFKILFDSLFSNYKPIYKDNVVMFNDFDCLLLFKTLYYINSLVLKANLHEMLDFKESFISKVVNRLSKISSTFNKYAFKKDFEVKDVPKIFYQVFPELSLKTEPIQPVLEDSIPVLEELVSEFEPIESKPIVEKMVEKSEQIDTEKLEILNVQKMLETNFNSIEQVLETKLSSTIEQVLETKLSSTIDNKFSNLEEQIISSMIENLEVNIVENLEEKFHAITASTTNTENNEVLVLLTELKEKLEGGDIDDKSRAKISVLEMENSELRKENEEIFEKLNECEKQFNTIKEKYKTLQQIKRKYKTMVLNGANINHIEHIQNDEHRVRKNFVSPIPNEPYREYYKK